MAKEKARRIIQSMKKHKKKTAIIAAAVIAVCGAGGFFAYKAHAAKSADSEQTVAETTAVTGTISNSIEGDGNLTAVDAENVSLPEGVSVKEWLVEEGDEVKKGDKIATLDAASVTSVLVTVESEIDEVEDELDSSSLTTNEKSNLNNQLTTLKAMKTKLTKYQSDAVVTAPVDGVIASVGTSSDDTSTTDSAQGAQKSSTTTAAAVKAAASGDETTATLVYLADDTKDETVTITDFSGFSLTAPATGSTAQATIGETDYYTGEISWSPSAGTFAADTVYTATVSLTPKDGYAFSAAYKPTVSGGTVSGSVNESTGVMTLTVTFTKTASASDDSDSSSSTDNSQSDKKSSSSKSQSSQSSSASKSQSSQSGAASGGGSSSMAGASGANVSSGSSSASSDSTGIDIISETDVCSISVSDSMLVSINVDEMDITSVSEGQEAVVTVEALEQSFTGSVTRISYEPVSSTSTVKYEVDITIESDDDMRIGMSATAGITLSSAEDVVTIPMSALQQEGDELFVYTEKDSDGSLSGKVTVKTGLSDGSTVEITDGLSDGDTVYYTRSAGDSDHAGGQDMFGGMGGMGGEMPDNMGGERPSGGPQDGGGQGGPPSN